MPWQVQGVDLPSIFLAAQQARANEQRLKLGQMQIDQAQRDADMQRWLPQARMDYAQGNPTDLQRLAPGEFQAAEKSKFEVAQAQAAWQLKTAEFARQRGLVTAQALNEAVTSLQQNPASYGEVRARLMGMQQTGAIDRFELPEQAPPPEMLNNMARATSVQIQALSKPDFSPELVEASNMFGLNPVQGIRDPRVQQAMMERWNKTSQGKQAGGDDPATKLRKEFQNLQTYKDTQLIASSFEKIRATTASAAGDMALVYNLMKVYDPGSAVRETEYATAENAAGVDSRIRTAWNRLLTGQRLSDAQRAEFKKEASTQFGAQMTRYNAIANQYKRLATQSGASPDDVVLPFGGSQWTKPQEQAPQGPAPQEGNTLAAQAMAPTLPLQQPAPQQSPAQAVAASMIPGVVDQVATPAPAPQVGPQQAPAPAPRPQRRQPQPQTAAQARAVELRKQGKKAAEIEQILKSEGLLQ